MAEEEKKEEKKIIIDEDWKQEAQKEKEILAAQEAAEKKETQEESKRRGPLPKGNFAALVSMLATQALFALGLLHVRDRRKGSQTWHWQNTISICLRPSRKKPRVT